MASTRQIKRQETIKKRLQKERLINEVVGIVLLFLGVIGIYTLFAENAGIVGNFYNKLGQILFGNIGVYGMMAVLIVCGIYIIVRYRPLRMNKKIFLLFFFLINFCAILHVKTIAEIADPFFKNMLNIAIGTQPGNAGGIFGMALSKALVQLLSDTGTYIFIGFVSLVLLLILFRKSLGQIMYDTREKIVTRDKSKADRDAVVKNETKQKEAQRDVRPFAKIEKWISQMEEESDEEETRDEMVRDEFMHAALKAKNASKQRDAELINIEMNKDDKDKTKKKDAQEPMRIRAASDEYVFPPLSLLDDIKTKGDVTRQETLLNAEKLQDTLQSFGIVVNLVGISVGPTVTRYELELEAGTRVNKIVNLSDDIALALAAPRVRIEAPIPGKSAVGIEVPNKNIATVHIHQVLSSKEFKEHKSPIAIGLGKDLSGQNLMCDLRKMPHILIAGATGSGKSVCINAILASIIYRSSPKNVRLILVDPKMVELNMYNGIPHLLVPVVTDPKQAASALNWAVNEMMDRYQKFADNKVRDIAGYNDKAETDKTEKMPLIVIIIDELADLMMVAPQQVESAICRLAQLARAAGIHLVLATQRPSVDVITGLIKANIPSRISFMVASQVDSRTILDMSGAEKLMGNGDMLYYPAGTNQPQRAQCAFISQREVERVVEYIKKHSGQAYNEEIIEKITTPKANVSDFEDDLFDEAVNLAMERGQISTSMIQRKLRIGYARAGRMIDEMEERGIVSPADGSRPRNVLMTQEEYYAKTDENQAGAPEGDDE